jgi:hypothetical protein
MDRDDWEKLHALLLDPKRRTNYSTGRRWMLSGLAECGKCGKPMRVKVSYPTGPRYTCPTEHLSIPAAESEQVIEAMILSTLDPATWKRLRSRGSQPVDTAELERQLADLVQQFEQDLISFDEWKRMRAKVVASLEDAAAEPVALPNVDDPRKAWPALSIDARRLIVTAVLPRIVIGVSTPGRKGFDTTRIIVPMTPTSTAVDSKGTPA